MARRSYPRAKVIAHLYAHPEDVAIPSRELGKLLGVSHTTVQNATHEFLGERKTATGKVFEATAVLARRTRRYVDEDGALVTDVLELPAEDQSKKDFQYNAHDTENDVQSEL